jgi:hypothetical protein
MECAFAELQRKKRTKFSASVGRSRNWSPVDDDDDEDDYESAEIKNTVGACA